MGPGTWRSVVAMAALSVGLAAHPLPTVTPVTLSSAWTTVGLPDAPLDVVAQDGKLWVGGENEMIAVSADGGHTWTVENERPKGEMLFQMVFPAPNEIVAYGSAGVRLESDDGGQSWKRDVIDPGMGFWRVVQLGDFAVAAMADSSFGASHDGGKHWDFHQLPAVTPRDKGTTAQPIAAIGALDAKHAAVLFEAGLEKQSLGFTRDGGKHWSEVTFPAGYAFNAVRDTGEGYVLYGEHQADHVPATAGSPDGASWKIALGTGVRETRCGPQGCLIPGGWTDLTGAMPRNWAVPDDADEPAPLAWAEEGAAFCFAREVLRCRQGAAIWTPGEPTALAGDSPGFEIPQPIASPDPEYPGAARDARAAGEVILSGVLGTGGRLTKITVVQAPRADLARSGRDWVAKKWRFKPARYQGHPITTTVAIELRFRLY